MDLTIEEQNSMNNYNHPILRCCILCGHLIPQNNLISRFKFNTTLYWHRFPITRDNVTLPSCFKLWQNGVRNER